MPRKTELLLNNMLIKNFKSLLVLGFFLVACLFSSVTYSIDTNYTQEHTSIDIQSQICDDLIHRSPEKTGVSSFRLKRVKGVENHTNTIQVTHNSTLKPKSSLSLIFDSNGITPYCSIAFLKLYLFHLY